MKQMTVAPTGKKYTTVTQVDKQCFLQNVSFGLPYITNITCPVSHLKYFILDTQPRHCEPENKKIVYFMISFYYFNP